MLHIVTYRISFIPEKQWNKNEYRHWKSKTPKPNKHSLLSNAPNLLQKRYHHSTIRTSFGLEKRRFYHFCLAWDRLLWVGRGGRGEAVPGYSQWQYFILFIWVKFLVADDEAINSDIPQVKMFKWVTANFLHGGSVFVWAVS